MIFTFEGFPRYVINIHGVYSLLYCVQLSLTLRGEFDLKTKKGVISSALIKHFSLHEIFLGVYKIFR